MSAKRKVEGKRRRTGARADKDPTSLCSLHADQKMCVFRFSILHPNFVFLSAPNSSLFHLFTSFTLCHMPTLTLPPASLLSFLFIVVSCVGGVF